MKLSTVDFKVVLKFKERFWTRVQVWNTGCKVQNMQSSIEVKSLQMLSWEKIKNKVPWNIADIATQSD